jgi:Fic family protein
MVALNDRFMKRYEEWAMDTAYHSYKLEDEEPSQKQIKHYARLAKRVYRDALVQPITSEYIRELHKAWYGKGEFRTHHTRPGVHPNIIDSELVALCDNVAWHYSMLRNGYTNAFTVRHMVEAHWQFEEIHPFEDGNGRTGRLLLVHMARWLGVKPPIIHAEWREQYISAMILGDISTLTIIMKRAIEQSTFPKTVPF